MRIFLYCVFTMSIAVVMLTACNSDNSYGNNRASVPGNLSTQTPSDGVRRITVTELKDAVDKNAVLILDARGPEAYAVEHIKGSINMLEGSVDARVGELPHDKMIVTYCS